MKGCMIYLNACFLRCLREFEKWSWIEKIGKNEEKLGKKFGSESPYTHYFCPILPTSLKKQSSKKMAQILLESVSSYQVSIFICSRFIFT